MSVLSCTVTEKLFEVMGRLWEEQKKPRDYGGRILYHSEIIFLDNVARYSGLNASEISQVLRVTKGAVTQIANKLANKGLLEIYTKPGNRKEKYYRLTAPGKEVQKEHVKFHENANKALCKYFSSLSAQETDTILGFLNQLKACVPFCEFECRCGTPPRERGENEYGPEYIEHSAIICKAGKWARNNKKLESDHQTG